LDPTHWTRPVTRFQAELFPEACKRGFGDSARRYGCLLEYMEFAFVNGFPYYRLQAVGAPPDASGHPPREVWDELAATHPEIRERLRTSAPMFERRLWREDLERWDREVKPGAVQAHLELLAVDPTALTTDRLVEYLDRCRRNQQHCAYLHHLFDVPAVVPVGDFLAHGQDWTGLPAERLLAALQGASPDPLGADQERERLLGALRDDPDAIALLDSPGEPRELLGALRSLPGATGQASAAYIDRVAHRPVNGEDVGEPSVIELPELVLGAIRAGLRGSESSPAASGLAERTAALRDAVPDRHRDLFDELLDEARLTYRLRDERGAYADLWAIGIMRRAILAAGHRLAARGLIADPTHLVEGGWEEIKRLVATGAGASGEELAERARYRLQARFADAPALLGVAPGAPLPADWLPPAAARLERALGAAVEQVFAAPEPRMTEAKVVGLGVSPGAYEGTARVVHGTEELARVQPGDVLVTNATGTAFNIVLPLLGAIVTDRGGLLSHAAIVAREFGIPAVVGTSHGTQLIADGAPVRVDGGSGEVTLPQ
jgi:pyruvate,water dikinase